MTVFLEKKPQKIFLKKKKGLKTAKIDTTVASKMFGLVVQKQTK